MAIYGVSLDQGKTWVTNTKITTTDPSQQQVWEGRSDDRGKTWNVYRKFVVSSLPPDLPPVPPTGVNIMGMVAVVNQTTNVSDATLKTWIDAVKIQADRDISRWWGYSVNFEQIPKGGTVPKADWYRGFFDNSDTAGAAGWHDVGPNREPLIKCFTKNAGNPSITFSHEIAESIGDTNANTTVKGFDEKGKACTYFLENCDPVEDNTYKINNVEVSDFVTKNWFVANSQGPYDFLNATNKPFQILQGGYMEISYDGGRTWQEVDKFSKHAVKHRSGHSRWALYKKPIEERVKSTFKVGK